MVSKTWQTSFTDSEAFQEIADKGIFVATYQNDSLSTWDISTFQSNQAIEIGDLSQLLTVETILNKVKAGEIDLQESIYDYLPYDFRIPQLRSTSIQDCISHLTGLPRLPNNIGVTQTDKGQPYKHYTKDDLLDFLRSWTPPTSKQYQYSLIGYALLQIAFGDDLGKPQHVPPSIMIQGHNRIGTPVDFIESGIFHAGIGRRLAIVQLQVLFQVWCEMDDPLPRFTKVAPTGIDPKTSIAAGWHIYQVDKTHSISLHKGSTAGHSTFIAICPQTKTGVVIATSKKQDLGTLGFSILSKMNDGWKTKP